MIWHIGDRKYEFVLSLRKALSYETSLRLRLIFFAFDFRFRVAGLEVVAGPGAMASVALSLALRGDGPLAAFIICITVA